MTKQKKFILAENEIPTQWYNILADMPNKPLPPIHPATKQPLTWQETFTSYSSGNQATIDLAGFGAYIPRGMFKTGIGYGASLD